MRVRNTRRSRNDQPPCSIDYNRMYLGMRGSACPLSLVEMIWWSDALEINRGALWFCVRWDCQGLVFCWSPELAAGQKEVRDFLSALHELSPQYSIAIVYMDHFIRHWQGVSFLLQHNIKFNLNCKKWQKHSILCMPNSHLHQQKSLLVWYTSSVFY